MDIYEKWGYSLLAVIVILKDWRGATPSAPGTSARDILAGLRSIVGGEITEYTKMLAETPSTA